MEERKAVLRLTGVTKQYRLGQVGSRTLQEDIQSWWAKIRGKEDPNSRIGQDQRLFGQRFMALNGIDLIVYKGEALGIIGGNGAGKSTLLKLLSRVTAPTDGLIDLYGRVSSMLEVGTRFNGQMTGRENIYMSGAILGMTKAEIDARLEDIIDFSEVREFIDTPVKRYSSGMFVKLALAVAAHLDSEIMIMDEVLAVGDQAFQKKCLTKMREAAEEGGRTVLYVSHNMNTIRELCDRCIVMDQGKIIFDGDVDQAVQIYMNHSVEEKEVDMNLAVKSHAGKEDVRDLEMRHLTLLEKVVPIFDSQEVLKMKFRLKINVPLSHARFRFALRTDTDQAVGNVWSEGENFEKKGEVEIQYDFPLNLLAKGIYYASIGFYRMDDNGTMIRLDHITRAFRIEVTSNSGMKNWSSHAYGNVVLPIINFKENGSCLQ